MVKNLSMRMSENQDIWSASAPVIGIDATRVVLVLVVGCVRHMRSAIGLDVHKNMCVAHATHCGLNEPKPKQRSILERVNTEFCRFPSDMRELTDLDRVLKGHEAHILMENSTKSHDVYWILKGLGLDVVVAHATDLKQITMSMRENDDNDAHRLAHYMRRRLLGEV